MTTCRRRASGAAAACIGFALVVWFGLSSAAAAPPPNNDFANAIPIASGQTLNGTNVDATKEGAEPNHGGNPGGASVWWKYTAPVAGPVTVRTCGSNFNTLLGVYVPVKSFPFFDSLASVAQNDDSAACGGGSLQSQVTFSADAGTTYYIAVDGAQGVFLPAETGNITISLSQVSLACDGRARLGSFNGDARRDLVFRRLDETFSIYLMNGFNVVAAQVVGQLFDNFKIIGVGDFNGDGKSDFVTRRITDGMVGILLMDGFTIVGSQQIGAIGLEWRFLGTGDLNGDGKSDLLFFRERGLVSMYLMAGFTVTAVQVMQLFGLEVVGIGDFSGDNKADIMARNPSDGSLRLFVMNGVTVVSEHAVGVVGTEWGSVAVGDFNGDGRQDLLFRRGGDGMLMLLLFGGNPPAVQTAGLLGAVGTEWSLIGAGDFDGDGKADLAFRRGTDGAVSIYLMDGFNVLAAQVLGAVGTEFTNCFTNPG